MKWKTIKQYPKYEINILGQVRNKKTLKVLKPYCYEKNNPYQQLTLMKENRKFRVRLHRLMGYTFLKLRDELVVHHKDRNPHNNKLDNLEVMTQEQNLKLREWN